MKHAHLLLCSLFIVHCSWIVSLGYAEGGAVTLEYRYTPGQVLHYRQEFSMKGNIAMAGEEGTPSEKSKDFSSKVVSRITMEVQGVDTDGSAVLNFRYNAIDMSQPTEEGGEETMQLENSPFKEWVGKTFSVRLYKDGRVVPLPGASGESADPAFKEILNQTEQMFSQMGKFLPDHPVRIGDSWQVEREIPIPGMDQRIKALYQNTLESFEKVGESDCAKIKSHITLSLPESEVVLAGKEENPSLALKVGIEGEGEAHQYFAVSEGLVVKGEGTTTVRSTQTFTLPAGENTFSQTLKNVSTMHIALKMEME